MSDKRDDRFTDDPGIRKSDDTTDEVKQWDKRFTNAPRIFIGGQEVFDPENANNEQHRSTFNRLLGEAQQKRAKQSKK